MKIKFIFIIFIETISVGYFILLYSLYIYNVLNQSSLVKPLSTVNIHDEYYTSFI